MREIKFRVWDKNNKRIFIDPQMIDFYNKKIGYMQYQTEYMPDTSYSIPVGFEEFEYSELMEWTGLYDKNGEDIYEGDILFESFGEKYYKVVFENGSFRAEFDGGFEEYSFDLIDVVAQGYEVVGNIYENPELLGDDE